MPSSISALTVNRLSNYLRALGQLRALGVDRISSAAMEQRFGLSAAQMRKDLAQLGELGIRGVGYDVRLLHDRLESVLGLDRTQSIVLVGAGNLGTALVRFPGLDRGSFRVVGVFDNDPDRIGSTIGDLVVRAPEDLTQVVARTGASLGVLTVPAEAAQVNYEHLADAGVRGVLNFAPIQLRERPSTRVKSVDLLVFLEELSFFLR